MQTSFFGNLKNLNVEDVVVVAIGFPKYMPREERERLATAKELMPTWDMVKRGYTYAEYVTLIEHDRHVTAEKVLKKYQSKILLCHERDPKECHRRMIARWIKERIGESVEEVEPVGISVNPRPSVLIEKPQLGLW